MEIQVVSVSRPRVTTKNGKAWNEIDIQYIGKNGEGKKTLRDFEGQIFKDVQQLHEGDSANVTVVKDGKYWNWTAVSKVAGSSQATAKGDVGQPFQKSKGDWETKEERANKQILIVRQHNITAAVAAIGQGASAAIYLTLAKQFEDYVFNGNIPAFGVDDEPTPEEME